MAPLPPPRGARSGGRLQRLPPSFHDDPYPVYAALREHDPVHRLSGGRLFVTRYADVERIYKDRFSVIFHLVPFYTGTKRNVIPVYENSYYFQGYVAQGFRHFEGAYRHYFFIADDMILNPAIDEHNYATLFDLDEASGFLPELDPMPAHRWPHSCSSCAVSS